jgi:hypothetical protein
MAAFGLPILFGGWHKVLTYIEYRAVSGVFRTIDPPPPSPPSECVLPPPHQRRGGSHSPGGEGVGVNILEDARHWIGLLRYYPSTEAGILWKGEEGGNGGGGVG